MSTSERRICPRCPDVIETYRTCLHSRVWVQSFFFDFSHLVGVGCFQKGFVARVAGSSALLCLHSIHDSRSLLLEKLPKRIIVFVGDPVRLHDVVVE
jgi:hypothetical protein